MDNREIAKALDVLAALRVLSGSNEWRARALTRAAVTVRNLQQPLATVRDIRTLPGIGEAIAAKIKELLATGRLEELESLKAQYPQSVLSMTRVPGIGVKTAFKLFHEYGVDSFDALKRAVEDGKITNARLVQSVRFSTEERKYTERKLVIDVLQPLLDRIQLIRGVCEAEFAGSIRREVSHVRDVDIVVAIKSMEDQATMDRVRAVLAKYGNTDVTGSTRDRVQAKLKEGHSIQVDLLFCARDSWGSAMNYFTGSKEHNTMLRALAKERGLKVNEYGIYRGEKKIGGSDEHDLYDILKLPYHPPQCRSGLTIMTQAQIDTLLRLRQVR